MPHLSSRSKLKLASLPQLHPKLYCHILFRSLKIMNILKYYVVTKAGLLLACQTEEAHELVPSGSIPDCTCLAPLSSPLPGNFYLCGTLLHQGVGWEWEFHTSLGSLPGGGRITASLFSNKFLDERKPCKISCAAVSVTCAFPVVLQKSVIPMLF